MENIEMSEPYETQSKLGGKFRKLMQERMGKANSCITLATEEQRQLSKFETISDKI